VIVYFPKPHPDELLYSILARFCVHTGEISPKRILDQLFSDRKVVAVVDLPSHINQLLENVNDLWSTTAEEIIYKHTLFPLYSPFIPETRKTQLIQDLKLGYGGKIHTRTGCAASIVPVPDFLRFCPACNKSEQLQVGEYYWKRLFQATGVLVCPTHQCLLFDSTISYRSEHRHQFFSSTPNTCINVNKISNSSMYFDKLLLLSEKIKELLDLGSVVSPTLWQWTQYYRLLAAKEYCLKGQRVKHHEIAEKLIIFWGKDFLKEMNCEINLNNSSWLKNLFRKHRKSFSYLQHILVWIALCPKKTIENIIGIVNSLPKNELNNCQNKLIPAEGAEIKIYRKLWVELINKNQNYGSNKIRGLPTAKRIYAWLYRHDRPWLLYINKEIKKVMPPINNRVNWQQRDLAVVKQLVRIQKMMGRDLNSPWLSKNCFLNKLKNKSTIENNIVKLPLCQLFFKKHTETLDQYQLRRCFAQVIQCIQNSLPIREWEVARISGVDNNRVLPITKQFLHEIEGISSEQDAIKSYHAWLKISWAR